GDVPDGPAEVSAPDGPSMSARSLQGLEPEEKVPSDSRLRERVDAAMEEVAAGMVRELEDQDSLADAVAAAVARVLEAGVAVRGVAHVALTGGAMGARTVSALADQDLSSEAWSRIHVWWGDERFVPEGHQDRNDQQARDAGLDRLPVPADNIHPAPSGAHEDELDEAAAVWAAELAAHAPEGGHSPRFDIVLLGLGPDAHVASLFPDHPALEVTDRATVRVTQSPKPPPLRLSLAVPPTNAAERVWLVATGGSHAPPPATPRAPRDDPTA